MTHLKKLKGPYQQGQKITVNVMPTEKIHYLVHDTTRLNMSWVTIERHDFPILIHNDMISTEPEADTEVKPSEHYY